MTDPPRPAARGLPGLPGLSGLLPILLLLACGGTEPAVQETTPAPAAGALAAARPPASPTPPSAPDAHLWPRVAAGQAVEVDFLLEAGDAVVAEFGATGQTMFDVHLHTETETVIYGRGEGSEGRVDFVAPLAGMYSFLWAPLEAGDQTIELSAQLTGARHIIQWLEPGALAEKPESRARGVTQPDE